MKKKILIIEDEFLMLQALSDKFTAEGFEVVQAEDGEKGLDSAFKENPDMILLDLALPKMDGLTLLSKLREDDRGKDMPVIILTNLSETEKVVDALSGGAYDYLVKTDWKLEDIVKKVKDKLKI